MDATNSVTTRRDGRNGGCDDHQPAPRRSAIPRTEPARWRTTRPRPRAPKPWPGPWAATTPGKFNISSDGALTFQSTPDYENPADEGTDNIYNVTVEASAGTESDSLDVIVTVTDVNEPPAISGGAQVSYAENGTGPVHTYTAADPESDALTWTLGGDDAGDFNISSDGALTFQSVPDFENPADEGGDNVYNVTVQVSDGKDEAGGTDSSVDATISVTIGVTNVNEPPPAVSGDAQVSYAENGTGPVHTYTAADPESDALTWTLGGGDAGQFNISSDGVPIFQSVPDFENPADEGGDNVYNVTVQVSDGKDEAGGADSSTDATISVTVSVTDVAEEAKEGDA